MSKSTCINIQKKLDQFFTNPAIADMCISSSLKYFDVLSYNLKKITFLEPSAGDGAFIKVAKSFGDVVSLDIEPKHKDILKNDFLELDIKQKNSNNCSLFQNSINTSIPKLTNRENLIVIGNPPFGNRSSLAIKFVNKAFEYSDTVCFILPLMFEKYSAQSKIDKRAKLILSKKLPDESFLFNGKPYSVRCCWQIWTLKENLYKDLRLKNPPITNHKYFSMWQYNNTKETEKYFEKSKYNWDFAVPRQGYKNYRTKVTDSKKLDKKTQWIFFKASSDDVLKMLYKIDFEKLSYKNTSVPGFGKADVVCEFNKLFPHYEANQTTQTFQLGVPKPSFA